MSELAQYIKSYFGVVQEKELETIVSLFKKTTLKKDVSIDYFKTLWN